MTKNIYIYISVAVVIMTVSYYLLIVRPKKQRDKIFGK
jgi:preprotein translocase subunit YajC